MNNQTDDLSSSNNKNEIESQKVASNIKHSFQQDEQIVNTIPLFEEKFTVTKKTEETQLILAKKLITSTKKIEIPIKYEEVFINGKEFDSYNESEIIEIFSKIKDKITDVFSHDKNKNIENKEDENYNKQQHPEHHQSDDIEIKEYNEQIDKENHDQNNLNEKLVPFSIDSKKNDDISNKREENIIPIWGEEIIINKKMVKLGEIIIKKHEINEKKKLEIKVSTEQLTVKYPDNHKEEII